MLSDFIRAHKIATTIIILIFIGLIGFYAFTLISRAGKEPVQIYLVPGDARLTLNGEEYRPGLSYIKPGEYEVKAEREGFESYQETITIGQPNSMDIDIALNPVSEEARQWQQDNLDGYLAAEGRAGARAIEEGKEFSAKNPIVDHLPFRNFIYTIGYKANPDIPNGIILTITAITGSREAALNKIRELGFDPTDYEINFNNYENPFSHE